MKIGNFSTGFNSNNQFEKRVRGSETAPDFTPAYRKASGGEDFLEISDEAIKRHKEAKILSFQDGVIKKEARNNIVIKENPIAHGTEKSLIIKNLINSDKYNFNDPEILAETAERVISFFR